MKLIGVALIAVWLTVVLETSEAATGPVILTSKGKVSGFESISRGGRIFQGWMKIPYAQPPLNNLRFMPPQTPKKWRGTLDGTLDTPTCMQSDIFMMPKNIAVSEDCLYLNIYRPKNHTLKYLPVLVYIHGGAFIAGSVGGRKNADYLMDEDVVLVEVNYRVNIFGFMSLNDEVVPGNNGMKDQVRALEWVKYNIKAFGGDSTNITVFGESAGGSSVHLLLKSPLSKDLINGAVSHSGTINPVWSLVKAESVKVLTLKAANIAGCNQPSSAELLKCLQDVEGEKLLQAFNQVNKLPTYSSFAPVIEPKTVIGAFATEDISITPTNKPWINTFTNGEYLLFVAMLSGQPDTTAEAFKNTSWYLKEIMSPTSSLAQKELAVSILEKIYLTDNNATMENFTLEISKILADESFTYPAMVTTENHGGPKWLGVLEYHPALKPSGAEEVAFHASNVYFYFNQTAAYPETSTPQFIAASKRMIKYLVNFAYYSDPTPPGSPFIWPQFETNKILRTTREGDIVGDQSIFNRYQKVKRVWDLARGWQ